MKKIIVQGRPFALEPCGIKNFSINFFSVLTHKLKDFQFEILVPKKVIKDKLYFGSNVKFIYIEPADASPKYLSTLLWENNQTLDYIKGIPAKEITFYISPYNCLPLTKLEIPEFVVLHDIDLWIDRGINWPIERRFGYEIKKKSIYNSDLIFTISEFSKKEISSYFKMSSNRIKVIYEDIDPHYGQNIQLNSSAIVEKLGVKTNNYFLYIGGFELRKNPNALFSAYYQYCKRVKKPKKLLVLGSFNERTKKQVKFDIAKLGNGCIFINRPLTFKELVSAYKEAFAFVYPSKYEGFGLQLLEAQASGTPLIISDIPTFKEIAGDGALYFNPDNPEKIAGKMIELENSAELRTKLIKEGYRNRKHFSWAKTVELFVDSIKNYL